MTLKSFQSPLFLLIAIQLINGLPVLPLNRANPNNTGGVPTKKPPEVVEEESKLDFKLFIIILLVTLAVIGLIVTGVVCLLYHKNKLPCCRKDEEDEEKSSQSEASEPNTERLRKLKKEGYIVNENQVKVADLKPISKGKSQADDGSTLKGSSTLAERKASKGSKIGSKKSKVGAKRSSIRSKSRTPEHHKHHHQRQGSLGKARSHHHQRQSLGKTGSHHHPKPGSKVGHKSTSVTSSRSKTRKSKLGKAGSKVGDHHHHK